MCWKPILNRQHTALAHIQEYFLKVLLSYFFLKLEISFFIIIFEVQVLLWLLEGLVS